MSPPTDLEVLTEEERERIVNLYDAGEPEAKALRIIDQQAAALAAAEAQCLQYQIEILGLLRQRDAASEILSAHGSFIACEALRALRGSNSAPSVKARLQALDVYWTPETGYCVRLAELNDALGAGPANCGPPRVRP